MEIHIFDENLNFLGIIDDFYSLRWHRKFYEAGEFELHCKISTKTTSLLKTGNIIALSDSIEAGQIHTHIYQSDNDEETIIVYGEFLSSILKDRIIPTTVNFNGFVETGMRAVINRCFSIPQLVIGESIGFSERVEFQVTYDNLHEYINKLSLSTSIGFRVAPNFETKQFIFSTYKGIDRSITQNKNAFVAFSDEYFNLDNANYSYSTKEHKNYAFVAGEGEGANRITVTVDWSNGEKRKEVFIDAKDIKQEDLSLSEYKNTLIQKGIEILSEYEIVESFESKILNQRYLYKKDWDLGDIVSVYKKDWNMIINSRVYEVEEIHENGKVEIFPIIGNPLPDKEG